MKTISKFVTVIVLALVMSLLPACKPAGTHAAANQHDANVRAIQAYYDSKVDLAKSADKGLVATVEAQKTAALAQEQARHETVTAGLQQKEKESEAIAKIKEAQQKTDAARTAAAATAAKAQAAPTAGNSPNPCEVPGLPPQ